MVRERGYNNDTLAKPSETIAAFYYLFGEKYVLRLLRLCRDASEEHIVVAGSLNDPGLVHPFAETCRRCAVFAVFVHQTNNKTELIDCANERQMRYRKAARTFDRRVFHTRASSDLLENRRHQTVQRSKRRAGETRQCGRINVRIVQIAVTLFQRGQTVLAYVIFACEKKQTKIVNYAFDIFIGTFDFYDEIIFATVTITRSHTVHQISTVRTKNVLCIVKLVITNEKLI